MCPVKDDNYNKVLVSACLLGECCKYDGGSNSNGAVMGFLRGRCAVPVCPEVLGGLPTPRVPAEIREGEVVSRDGASVDAEFRAGAARALRIAVEEGVQLAVLQPRSPSCGVREVYDGSFCGRLVRGSGVFASLLAAHGIKAVEPQDLPSLLPPSNVAAAPPETGAPGT